MPFVLLIISSDLSFSKFPLAVIYFLITMKTFGILCTTDLFIHKLLYFPLAQILFRSFSLYIHRSMQPTLFELKFLTDDTRLILSYRINDFKPQEFSNFLFFILRMNNVTTAFNYYTTRLKISSTFTYTSTNILFL